MAASASAPRHRGQRRAPMRSMAIITSTAAGTVLLALGATGTTLASWSDSAPMSAGSIATGSLDLLVDTQTAIDLPDTLFRNMLPGDRATREVVVTTEGNISTDLTVAGSSFVHEMRISPSPCNGSPIGGPALGSTPVNLGEWSAEEAQTVCIEVTLPMTAPSSAQGVQSDLELTFVATQRVD